MSQIQKRRQRDVLLTTLIDLLVQLLFVFLLVIVVVAPKDGTGLLLEQARQLMKQTGKTMTEITTTWRRLIDPDSLSQKQKELLAAAADYERLKKLEKEIEAQRSAERKREEELEQQVKYYQEKFRALGDPPCMFAENSSVRPAPLFSILVTDDGMQVTPRWPTSREKIVQQLPVPFPSLSKIISIAEFQGAFKPLYEATRRAGCRHYVVLNDKSTSAPRSNAQRAAIEGFFYLLASTRTQ